MQNTFKGTVHCVATTIKGAGASSTIADSTDTQFLGAFNQYSYSPHGRIAGNTTNRISEISRAQAGNRTRDLWIDSPVPYH